MSRKCKCKIKKEIEMCSKCKKIDICKKHHECDFAAQKNKQMAKDSYWN